MEYTTIQVSTETRKRLEELKVHPNQSYEEVVIRLLEANEILKNVHPL